MLWGAKQEAAFKKVVVKGYAKTVLGFNECVAIFCYTPPLKCLMILYQRPNQKGQSNMTPADAVIIWRRTILPLKKLGYRLVSPATTCDPKGLLWIQEFMRRCGADCGVRSVLVKSARKSN